MVAGEDDNKAHKTPVTLGASANGMTVEITSGVKAGDRVIVRGQDGLPDEAAHHGHQMNPARVASRHSRAVLLLTALLAVAGAIAASRCRAASIRRCSSRASSSSRTPGTLPRAVDDADGHAAARAGDHGSARHPPRALAHVPRRDGDLGAVRSGHRHGRRAAAGAEPRRRDPRRRCRPTPISTVERLTPAVFPIFSLNLTGGLSTADLHDYGVLRHAAGARARARRRAASRCSRATRARSRSSSIRRKLLAAELTVDDVADGAQEREPARAGRPLSGERPAAPRARVGPLEVGRRHRRRRRSSSRAARRCASRDLGDGRAGRARSHVARSSARAATRPPISVSQQIGANILDRPRRASRTRSRELTTRAARRPAARPRPTTSPSSCRPRSPTCATPSSSAASSPCSSCCVFLRDWRLTLVAAVHAAAHGHRRRSSSCGCSASRST